MQDIFDVVASKILGKNQPIVIDRLATDLRSGLPDLKDLDDTPVNRHKVASNGAGIIRKAIEEMPVVGEAPPNVDDALMDFEEEQRDNAEDAADIVTEEEVEDREEEVAEESDEPQEQQTEQELAPVNKGVSSVKQADEATEILLAITDLMGQGHTYEEAKEIAEQQVTGARTKGSATTNTEDGMKKGQKVIYDTSKVVGNKIAGRLIAVKQTVKAVVAQVNPDGSVVLTTESGWRLTTPVTATIADKEFILVRAQDDEEDKDKDDNEKEGADETADEDDDKDKDKDMDKEGVDNDEEDKENDKDKTSADGKDEDDSDEEKEATFRKVVDMLIACHPVNLRKGRVPTRSGMREFWKSPWSDEVFVVELEGDVVTDAYGPLTEMDYKGADPDDFYMNQPGYGDVIKTINENKEQFTKVSGKKTSADIPEASQEGTLGGGNKDDKPFVGWEGGELVSDHREKGRPDIAQEGDVSGDGRTEGSHGEPAADSEVATGTDKVLDNPVIKGKAKRDLKRKAMNLNIGDEFTLLQAETGFTSDDNVATIPVGTTGKVVELMPSVNGYDVDYPSLDATGVIDESGEGTTWIKMGKTKPVAKAQDDRAARLMKLRTMQNRQATDQKQDLQNKQTSTDGARRLPSRNARLNGLQTKVSQKERENVVLQKKNRRLESEKLADLMIRKALILPESREEEIGVMVALSEDGWRQAKRIIEGAPDREPTRLAPRQGSRRVLRAKKEIQEGHGVRLGSDKPMQQTTGYLDNGTMFDD